MGFFCGVLVIGKEVSPFIRLPDPDTYHCWIRPAETHSINIGLTATDLKGHLGQLIIECFHDKVSRLS